MAESNLHESFSAIAFARRVSWITGWTVLLLAVAMVAIGYFLRSWSGEDIAVAPGFAATAVLYLGFIFGWAMAYGRDFRFPERQRILVAGAGIAAAIASLIGGLLRLAYQQTTLGEWLGSLPAHLTESLFGALLQIYILAIILRYVERSRLPF